MKYLLVGLLAAFVAIGVVFFFLAAPQPEVVTPDAPAQELVALRQDLDQAESDRIQLQEELSTAKEQIKELKAKATETETLVQELIQSAAEENQVTEAETPEEEKTEREISLDEIVSKLRDNAQASAQLQALTEMLYADFLNGIDLDPDAKAELRSLLRESFLESMALSQFAMRTGDVPWNELNSWQMEERAFLDEQLRSLLPDEDYDKWSDYLADVDVRQLDVTLRNQIKAFASGLTPDSFEAVIQVAIEQFRAEQLALEQSNTLYTLSENVYYQIRAMTAMREQLLTFLPPDQMAEIENWLTMGENLLMAQLPQDAGQ